MISVAQTTEIFYAKGAGIFWENGKIHIEINTHLWYNVIHDNRRSIPI